jgi:hypothetical protein
MSNIIDWSLTCSKQHVDYMCVCVCICMYVYVWLKASLVLSGYAVTVTGAKISIYTYIYLSDLIARHANQATLFPQTYIHTHI